MMFSSLRTKACDPRRPVNTRMTAESVGLGTRYASGKGVRNKASKAQ